MELFWFSAKLSRYNKELIIALQEVPYCLKILRIYIALLGEKLIIIHNVSLGNKTPKV